jgi:hypothetical protein
MYHRDRSATYWHLFAKGRILDLKFNREACTLTEVLLPGQQASPEAFLAVLQAEFIAMEKGSSG